MNWARTLSLTRFGKNKMKECPQCKRTYNDSLSFCLEDGSVLSAAYAAEETLIIPQSRTQQNVTYSASQPHKSRILLFGIVLVLAILLTAGAVLLLQQKRSDSDAVIKQRDPSPAESSVTPGASNSSTETRKSDDLRVKQTDIKTSWLEGVWEGAAYQINTQTTWTIKLTVRNDTYSVEYPSLDCGGNWILVDSSGKTAKFKERITFGLSRCVDNGYATIERISDSQIQFKYNEPNSTVVVASAVLNKK